PTCCPEPSSARSPTSRSPSFCITEAAVRAALPSPFSGTTSTYFWVARETRPPERLPRSRAPRLHRERGRKIPAPRPVVEVAPAEPSEVPQHEHIALRR